jgi:uncharacterized membrane protein YhdT
MNLADIVWDNSEANIKDSRKEAFWVMLFTSVWCVCAYLLVLDGLKYALFPLFVSMSAGHLSISALAVATTTLFAIFYTAGVIRAYLRYLSNCYACAQANDTRHMTVEQMQTLKEYVSNNAIFKVRLKDFLDENGRTVDDINHLVYTQLELCANSEVSQAEFDAFNAAQEDLVSALYGDATKD